MKAKLIEYKWDVDNSMDPYARSGEEKRVVGAILIPGTTDVLVAMHNGTPEFRELSHDSPGSRSLFDLGINVREREFHIVGKIDISETAANEARTMASHEKIKKSANAMFSQIFSELARKE